MTDENVGLDEWRRYDGRLDSEEAGDWDQTHADWCTYWPDCQTNGDHPNPLIRPTYPPVPTDAGGRDDDH